MNEKFVPTPAYTADNAENIGEYEIVFDARTNGAYLIRRDSFYQPRNPASIGSAGVHLSDTDWHTYDVRYVVSVFSPVGEAHHEHQSEITDTTAEAAKAALLEMIVRDLETIDKAAIKGHIGEALASMIEELNADPIDGD